MRRRVLYWSLFAAMLFVYGAMLGWTLPGITEGAGGLPPFDLRLTGYSGDEARAFLAALNAPGRALYLGPQRILDMAYPALLAMVLAGALFRFVAHRWVRLGLVLVVLGGMVADYRENYLVALMLGHDGAVPEALVIAASRATVIKSGLTGFAMLALGVALALAAGRRWKSG
jgi:hypothetical protein